MTEKTYIKGKDSDLESSIATMQAKLESFGFDIEQASWLNPVSNVYSVHIRDKSCPLMFTNGKGSTEKSCLASALGEYFERLSCNYFFADFYLGEKHSQNEFVHYPNERWFNSELESMPEGLMDEGLWRYFDPDSELSPSKLFDINSGTGERGICAAPYQRLGDGKTIYIPINIIANIFVSNGMSAGNTKNEARVQSLSELFERYVKNKIIAEGISLPEVPDEVLNRYPSTMKAVNELKAHGYSLKIADASLGGRYPVISVTLINPKDGSVFASFGAHPSFEVALERTVTELLQGRNLDQLDVFHPPIFDLEEVASPQNLEMHFIDSSGYISNDFFKKTPDYEFSDWDHDGNTEDEFTYLSDLVHQLDFDIYIADYEHLNVYACRILVPGMSDIYPVDELVWENNNEGALFREDFLSLTSADEAKWSSILERLDDGAYNDQTLAASFIGLAPDPDTLWTTVRLGEIKAMLCLALQDEQAIDWIDWCLSLDQASEASRRHYLCLKALLDIKWDDEREFAEYQDGLALMYGQQTVSDGIAIVEGKTTFHNLLCPGLSLKGFERHTRLLEGYEKLQQAKLTNWK
ncbi:MAG: 30s ribosomal protein S12 methylthiotransferase accessory protein YcaO [Gammaproteobacteria bacterium]|nr:MAG: 30s ribosomal protein S12 methylthiotransferase accessory protein YcaO [Gammaproteobacteria bacterium]